MGDRGNVKVLAAICDNEHPIVTLDCESQVVRLQNEAGDVDYCGPIGFTDYVKDGPGAEFTEVWENRGRG